jgi:excisionase family DNA binding protein
MTNGRIAVTIADATKIAGLGRSTLYKLFDAGEIVPRKSGRRTLILVDELDRYIRSLPSSTATDCTSR